MSLCSHVFEDANCGKSQNECLRYPSTFVRRNANGRGSDAGVRQELDFRMISFWFMGLGFIIHFQARKEISMDGRNVILGIICKDCR